MKILKIKWRDSAMFHEQDSIEGGFTISEFESIGFLIYEDKKIVVIARDLIRNDYRSALAILKETIVSRKTV